MNRLITARSRQIIIYLMACAVVLFNGWLLESNFSEVNQQQASVKHTATVIKELDSVVTSMIEAESNQRGYLLTHEQDFLNNFKKVGLECWEHLALLRRLTSDNFVQQATFASLESAAHDRYQMLDSNIALFRSGANKDPTALLEGRDLMQEVRVYAEKMRAEENRLLSFRTRAVEQARSVFFGSLIVTTFLTLLAFSLAYTLIRRTQRRLVEEARASAHDAWVRGQVAEMSQLMAGETNLNRVSRLLLEQFAQVFHALGANFYALEGGHLHLLSSYAAKGVESQISVPQKVALEQSLLGEAALKEAIWEISDVPTDYMPITSSLGATSPKSLLFFPVRFQGESIGVIEMALFHSPTPQLRQLMETLMESVGTGVSAALSRERLKLLLDETTQQAEELQAQQEELRASNEELEQQARALESQQQLLNNQNRDLEASQRSLETKAAELQRTSQYKSEFLAKMSHELRTPLNSLLILATLLAENKEDNLTEQQRSFAKSMHGAGEDLLNLINEILDLSKIEARKMPIRIEEFSLGDVFDVMENSFMPQAHAKNLVFNGDLPRAVRSTILRTDRQRLEQILRNFLSNALKFTEKGSITVKASVDETRHMAIIEVKDTGIGIPMEKHDVVFEAFEQADSSVSRKYGGTGLGLTISRELAALLGGSIRLESQEGMGSSFILEFKTQMTEEMAYARPLSSLGAPAPTLMTTHSMSISSSEAIKMAREITKDIPKDAHIILVVEDDETFRRTVIEATTSHGFYPLGVADGEVALEVLKLILPTAILLDIKLPGISGLGLLEMIKQMPRLRHIPIHMISALEHQKNALRMGALGYLGKPVTIDQIRSILTRIESMLSKKVKRLLVIEDDDRQREAIIQLVSGKDIEVISAHSAAAALEILRGEGADCVILDLALPDLSGFELLDKLDQLDISLPPVVIYTGQDLTRSQEEALRRHSDSIIIKGARSPERLLDEVNLFLHRVEEYLPEDKRAMLSQLRSQEKVFEGKTALLVDDDMRNLFALTSALEAKGLNVRIARDGVEALEALEQHTDIDIVLMDIMMPRMDGYQAMRQIRAINRFADLPIIALTAKAMREDHERCVEAGANDYLPKPLNLTNLLSVLRVWLTREDIF